MKLRITTSEYKSVISNVTLLSDENGPIRFRAQQRAKHSSLFGVRGTGYGVRGTGSRGTGSRGMENAGCGKTRGVENAGSGGKGGIPFFSPKYEFSSVK